MIPAGGNVEVTATYGGSDASSYTTITKTVKISRKACVEDNKIVYTGAGESACRFRCPYGTCPDV